MSGQVRKVPGPHAKSLLITVRVTVEQRYLLHRIAADRGETLSRMLLSPWLDAHDHERPKRSAQSAAAAIATRELVRAHACLEVVADTRVGDESLRIESASAGDQFVGQGSLFGAIGGDR